MRIAPRPLGVVSVVALLMAVALPASAQFLYSGSSFSPTLYSLNPASGATVNSVTVVAAGYVIQQVKGLAAEPTTGELFAVLRGSAPGEGANSFFLATVRPDTGEATVIGELGDAFAGLAFDGGGTLYGVTGDGAFGPEILYTINTSDATVTGVMNLGNGTDGETIAFNSGDGLMYHLSGWATPPEGGLNDVVFEKIDLGTMTITDIPLSGDFFINGNGLAYDATQGDFVVAVLNDVPAEGGQLVEFARISTNGVVSISGPLDEYAGGMAFSEFVPVELMSFSVE